MNSSVAVTRCPSCETAFHVTAEELNAASGQVRCGSCLEVFLARDQMIVEQKSLFDEADEISVPPEESVDFSEQPSADYFLGEDEEEGAIETEPSSKLWVVAVLLLLVMIPLQLIYWQPPQLVKYSWYPKFLERSCELLNCEVQAIDQVQLINVSGTVLGSGNSEILVADLRITNRAPISQPLPNLILQFQNLQGRETASREFLPSEYLRRNSNQNQSEIDEMIAPGEVVEARIELIDPGPTSINYEFWLRSSKTASQPL